RRMNAPDGRFLGVIVAVIDIAYLQSLFDSVHLPHSPLYLLLRQDGTVLVRFPDERVPPGEKLPADSQRYDIVAHGGGDFISPGRFGGQPRMVAAQPLREYPLVLDVSVAEAAVLGPWKRDALLLGAASALIIAYAVFLLRMHGRQLHRVRQSEAS